MKEALTSRFFWSGFFLAIAIVFFLMFFNVLYTKWDLKKEDDAFQEVVKSSADKKETAQQLYDNLFVKNVDITYYIPKS